ncbi:hypothetical protein H5410_061276 [Solanum commersonii]|uniref:Uncharacterized protein n=1 Tax=Solanum commersonii TaxID=4109 RepID=A0A9J5W950_SOLCO|nr:hypothetical protein H5410_061276 [Solanum commersonii]
MKAPAVEERIVVEHKKREQMKYWSAKWHVLRYRLSVAESI